MGFRRGRRWTWIALGVGSVLVVGTATAAKLKLTGYMVEMDGGRKMVFEDQGRSLTCPSSPISMAMMFLPEKQWVGDLDGDPIGGKWKQQGDDKRKVKIVFDAPSLNALNQYIDDEVSLCILSIPDGLPLKFKDVEFKGKLNKSRRRLRVKGNVVFRSKEKGLLWDISDDTKDVFKMNVRGALIPPAEM